ncbi:hypothetical protein LFT44_21885 (plasmid) [Arthrobacter sp. FW306-05-C]|uniref:Uncharacterized protein n=1 Tax=Pseudarthrobacter enclensis TaxID=993070 RepID=A0ABT9RTS0_9MICC|nr:MULTISPECIES: hypothetical protein [Micrococcaceae]MDP9888637.1 hypothetical protein [Pseudarthrobacter enclensis]UKA69180.1 hypothetical protein LFT44_21885 [Arthrobacter sp. FW306-05-C]
MGLENFLWKRAFNTMQSELHRRGYTASMQEDTTKDSPESRTIRVVCSDTVVDLYIRSGYWTFDTWIKLAGGWHHSNVGEIVQDRYRLRAGFTDLTSRTPHGIVLDTLVHNFVLPEFRHAMAPDPAASRVPRTSPGPAAHLQEEIISEPSVHGPQHPFPANSNESADVDDGAAADQEEEYQDDDYEDDYDYEDEEEEDESPVEAGMSPKDALQDLQLVVASFARLRQYDDPSHLPETIAAWGSSFDPAGRRSDGYLITAGLRVGFFRPEELRSNPSAFPGPPVFLVRDCELVSWGKPYDVSLDVPGCGAAENNRLGLFTVQMNAHGISEEQNFSIEYGQYDAARKSQVVEFMREFLNRVS